MRQLIRLAHLGAALACVLLPGGSAAVAGVDDPGPIVVEHVAEASAGARAGLAAGDLLLDWSRDGSTGSGDAGPLGSPFEFRRIEEEESAFGTIVISGRRGDEPRRWRMPSAPWGIEVRPQLPPRLSKASDAALNTLDGASPEDDYFPAVLEGWRGAVADMEALGDPLAGAWLLAESGVRLIDSGARIEGDAAFGEAITTASEAEPSESMTAIPQLYGDWAAALERAGDLDAASSRLAGGLAIAGDASLARAHLLSRLGALARRTGDLDRAESMLGEAMAIRATTAPDTLLVSLSLYELLLLARSRGDLETAESVGRRALEIQEADDAAGLAAARTRETLGQIALMRGDFDTAEELFLDSYETFSVIAPGTRDHGSAATSLGILARRQGDAETAMARFSEALSIFEALNPTGGAVAMLNNNIGVVAYDYGDLARSEEHLARALTLHERTAPDSLEIALYLDNLAGIAQERGDLARAERLYRRALARREQKAPGSLEVATTLANLGNLLQQRGDLERARVYYERALETQRSLAHGSPEEAATLSDIGILAERQGDLALAEERLRQSLRVRESVAPDSLEVASALSALASLSLKQGDPSAADELAARALAIREEKTGASVQTAASLYQLGRLALHRGEAAAAAAYHRRALDLRRTLVPGSHWVASSWNGLGEALRMSGEGDAGLDALCRATEILDHDMSRVSEIEEGRASFRAAFGDYYRDCIGALVAAGRERDAYAALERFRARWLLAMLAERDILFEADLPPDLSSRMRRNQIEFDRLVTAISRIDPGEESDAAEDHFARMIALREEREEIAGEIRRLSPRLADLQYPEPLTFDDARRTLPPATVHLSYSVGSDSTVLFVLRRVGASGNEKDRQDALRTFEISLPRENLEAAIRSLRDAIDEREPIDRLEARAAELYDLLIRPAEPMMKDGEALLISPDGPLNVLPFAALVRKADDGSRSYLVEKRPLHFVISASVYAQLARPLRPRRDGEPVLVAFGDPSYGSAGRSGGEERRSFVGRAADLRPLPHARREVQGIAALFDGKVEVHLGDQATEARAKHLAERADYVHFACHGFLDERFPLGSTLAMALPAGDGADTDNGFLQAWEIIEQVRLDASLVTLSACETGLGSDMGGEGLIGLVRAFQYAGARSVVASLWSVADLPTSGFMQAFYQALQRGQTKADALRAAQISFIGDDRVTTEAADDERGVRRLVGSATDAGPSVSHPYYWAAFQLFGAR